MENVQGENAQNSHVSSDEEVVDNGPRKHMKKPKIRRWKLQARNHNGKEASKSEPITKKRLMGEVKMTSPNTKNRKLKAHERRSIREAIFIPLQQNLN